MLKNKFSKISSIIQDAKKGKMFILVDDKNRENEGDLIIPGSKCNSKSINFMAKHGRGLICLALTKRQVDNLKLPLMSSINKSRMQNYQIMFVIHKKKQKVKLQRIIKKIQRQILTKNNVCYALVKSQIAQLLNVVIYSVGTVYIWHSKINNNAQNVGTFANQIN